MAPCRTASAAGPNEADLSGNSRAMWAFEPLCCVIAVVVSGGGAMSGVAFVVGFSGGTTGALCAGAAMGWASLIGADLVEVAQPPLSATSRIVIRKVAIRCIRKMTRQVKTYYM